MSEPTFSPRSVPTKAPRTNIAKLFLSIVTLCILGGCALGYFAFTLNKAPTNFQSPTSFTIEPGEGVKTITTNLENAHIVRSKTLLYFVLTLRYDTKSIKASTYIFDKPLSTTEIAKKLVTGDFDTDLIKFTHIEGERATDIALHAQATLTNFDTQHFLERAVPLEGKLYPETYLIPKTFTADELVDLMLKTFNEKTAAIQAKMESYTLTPQEILILASILEREANSPESMRVVSGILQRRLKEGIRLQADASIEYVLNKPLKELAPKDLEIDSPYNTYRVKGLPPTPIGNPGLEAITAVIEPTPSEYTYYITDTEGTFHYAKTYKEHLANVAKYLR
jgi:UPF0755 protein